jgi:hypothetical protein
MAFSILAGLSGARNLLSSALVKYALLGLVLVSLCFTIYIQSVNIDKLRVEKRLIASECNERIMAMIAESQQVGIKAQAEAVLKERAEWQLRIDASLKSAAIAAKSRTEAELWSNELQHRLDQVYKESQDAENWRNTSIPDAILGLRDR